MKLVLSKPVKGIIQGTNNTRLHGLPGDVLFVLLISQNYYLCDSLYYPNEHVIVFKNQVERIEQDDISLNEKETNFNEYRIQGIESTGNIEELIKGEDISTGYGD